MKKIYTGHTRLFLCVSGAIIVVALVMQIIGLGMNMGIDFTGGSILNYSVGEEYDVNDVEAILNASGFSDNQITKAAPSAASIAIQQELAAEKAAEEAKAAEEVAAAEAEAAEEAASEAVEETAEEATEAVEATAEEAVEEVTETVEETAETAEEAAEAVEETAEEVTEAVEETAEEVTEEVEDAFVPMLNLDKSSIKADGMTDLAIRLKLADATEGMEDAIVSAVKGVVSGANKTDYRTLTNLEITSSGYKTSFAGGHAIEFDMGGDFDKDAVEQAVREALTAGGYDITEMQLIRYDANAEAAQAAEPVEETAETEETEATEDAESAEAVEETEAVIEETGNSLRILIDMDDVTSQVRASLEREMSAKYPNFRFVSIDHVSAIAGRDLLSNAIKALLIAFVCMLAYIAIRFSPLSGCAALFALVHDILIMCSFMVFFRASFQVNSSFIAAILTIVGYSINNTIIIFDRIRENRKKPGLTQKPMMEVVETSVATTLARTINTTLTTLITLVCLYIFGVSSIKEFAFPLIVGMLAGTYSSVLLSGQVWAMWDEMLAQRKAAAKQAK